MIRVFKSAVISQQLVEGEHDPLANDFKRYKEAVSRRPVLVGMLRTTTRTLCPPCAAKVSCTYTWPKGRNRGLGEWLSMIAPATTIWCIAVGFTRPTIFY